MEAGTFVKSHLLQLKKSVPWISHLSQFFDFESELRETERSYNLVKRIILTSIYDRKTAPDVLTLYPRFYDLSVSRNPVSNSKSLFFFIVRMHVIWQLFQLQFMIKKSRSDVLTLSMTFYDLSVSSNIFLKAEMRQFSVSENPSI